MANTPRELQNGPGDILKANRFATLRILAAYLYVENITKREDPRALPQPIPAKKLARHLGRHSSAPGMQVYFGAPNYSSDVYADIL